MAFLRYARANVVKPQILNFGIWDKVRVASGLKTSLSSGLDAKAEEILGERCTPDKYVLTHATIVCSVDATTPPGTKTGTIEEGGQKIIRKYADYRITSETDKYINNNLDSWSRGVLKKSYHTFIGAQNFMEHIQVEELSKGRIIDAVLRDIGESLYVDILVATNRKHKELVSDILSGKMNSMSMGCSVDFTICSKCGNVAADETEFCNHVKYEKGNTFFDEQGNKHRVAELCGHESVGETGGVTFIEASWVATPAFAGAVARNIIQFPGEEKLNEVPEKWVTKKSASFHTAGMFDDDEESEEGDAEKDAPSASILERLEGAITDALIDRIKNKIEKEMRADKAKEVLEPAISESTVSENDTIVKEGRVTDYLNALTAAVRIASSNEEALDNINLVNRHYDIQIPKRIYRLARQLGPSSRYNDLESFLNKAASLSEASLNNNDKIRLVRLAKLLSTKRA